MLVEGGDKDNGDRHSPMALQAEVVVVAVVCVARPVCGTRSALAALLRLSSERCRGALRFRNVRFWIIGMFATVAA